MNDTPQLPLAECDAPPTKPKRDNCRWTTGDDGQLLDKIHMGWPMKKVAESLERTVLGCSNRLGRILHGKVATRAGSAEIVATLRDRAAAAADAKRAARTAKTAGKTTPAGGGTGNGAVGRSLGELHKRMGGLERVLVEQGRMRQLVLAIELAAGRLSFDVVVAEIGAVPAGQCRRLADDIVGCPDLADRSAGPNAEGGTDDPQSAEGDGGQGDG